MIQKKDRSDKALDNNILQNFKKSILKPVFVVPVVLFLFLFSFAGVFAYQYYLKAILPCSEVSAGGICFELKETSVGTKKPEIKNLDSTKKYKLVIKRKVSGDQEIEVGSVNLDLANYTSQCKTRQQSSNSADMTCCSGLVLKNDLWNTDANDPLYVCCKSDECAQDGICIANGRAFPEWKKECSKGNWRDWNAGPDDICSETDGGENYYQKGHLTWPSGNFEADDTCRGDYVLEYYCYEGFYKQKSFLCPNGCEDGACKTDTATKCTDSDGGINYYTKGHLTWTTQAFEADDFCSPDTGELMEYFCDESGEFYEDIGYQCPNGCEDGACKSSSSNCKNYGESFEPGTVDGCCINTVSILEAKQDLWTTPEWTLYTCCLSEECAQDGICVANGESFSDWGKKCKDGDWIELTY